MTAAERFATRNGARGNCYVTCEALYHLLGGKASGWVPYTVTWAGDTHWFLRHRDTGLVLDPTRGQFTSDPPYHLGRGRGFLTRGPSRRAHTLMAQMLWQETP